MKLMRSVSLLLAMLPIASCDLVAEWTDPAIGGCKKFITERLKSPSSFRVISVHTENEPISLAEWAKMNAILGPLGTNRMTRLKNTPGLHRIIIEYDADNSFGVALRSRQVCDFSVLDIEEIPSKASVDAAISIVGNRTPLSETEMPDCCADAFSGVRTP